MRLFVKQQLSDTLKFMAQNDIDSISKRLAKIEARNERVEADKAWEVSWQRRILILALTYLLILLYFFIIEAEKPFLNAIVPTLGFFLSTRTLSIAKKAWINRN